MVRQLLTKCLLSKAKASEIRIPVAASKTYNACSSPSLSDTSLLTAFRLRAGRRCSFDLMTGRSISLGSHLRGCTGSPVLPSLSEATTCSMYSTYLLTVRADSDCFILVTNGFTVMLWTFPKGESPMAGRIHLFRATSMLELSLMGSRSRVVAHRTY